RARESELKSGDKYRVEFHQTLRRQLFRVASAYRLPRHDRNAAGAGQGSAAERRKRICNASLRIARARHAGAFGLTARWTRPARAGLIRRGPLSWMRST